MQVIILAALIAVAAASNAYPPKAYPAPAYPAPAYGKSYDYAPQPYSFDWEVNDAPSYNNYGHSEKSDGKVTTGSYRVALPDGRTQIVTYRADSYGYVADVKYEGVAKYPEYKPAAYYSAPAYKAPY
ncbi:pro-resilin-like [Daphnia pulicaria]|uniref:pro-resilin-like n=1 Tax=Daphnia pulicaria TaxID=35523 RepID=UPI001EEC88D7|nr:pro-resilin-like [Daphnia pulicaria]